MISKILNSLRYPARTSYQPHVVVIGGSYAGVSAVQNMLGLLQGRGLRPSPIPLRTPEFLPGTKLKITVLDRRDGFFHTMGSPLALTSRLYADKAWQAYRDCTSFRQGGVRVVHGEATRVDVRNKIIAYESHGDEPGEIVRKTMPYDYLVVTTGLGRTWPAAPIHSTKSEYLGDAEKYSRELERVDEAIVIVGGGAVGVEMSAEIALACPSKKVVLVHSREELLSSEPVPVEFKEKVRQLLGLANVEVQLGKRVVRRESFTSETGMPVEKLALRNGEVLHGGKVIFCTARPAPNAQFLPTDCLNEHGHVKVNPDLSFASDIPNAGYHFAAGDIAAWNGMKSVGGALLMGQCAAINIIGQLGAASQRTMASRFTPVRLPPFPLIMTLEVGENAAMIDMDGSVDSGRHLREAFFGSDMALTRTRDLLGLFDQGSMEERKE